MEAVESLHHVGIAVRSIEAHRAYYEEVLGAVFEDEQQIEGQQVRVAFFRVGDVRLELLEPTSVESTIAKFLQNRGEGLHHLAFTVSDLQARITELSDRGVAMIDQTPRSGAHGMQIAFMHPSSTHGVLTELCELPAAKQ